MINIVIVIVKKYWFIGIRFNIFLKYFIVVKIIYIYMYIINNLLYKIIKIFIFIVINLFKLYF